MKRYIDNGGSILLTLNEGGEGRQTTNVNVFLQNYGIEVNDGNHLSSLEFPKRRRFALDF